MSNTVRNEVIEPGDPRVTAVLLALLRGDTQLTRTLTAGWTWSAWAALVVDAMRHGVAPLVHGHLQDLPGTDVPTHLQERLRDLAVAGKLEALAVIDQTKEVLDGLAVAGIPVIPLKGVYLAEQLYADPALRPMQDIDLLVRSGDMASSSEVLKEMGYAPGAAVPDIDYGLLHHRSPLHREGRLPVELHHGLVSHTGGLIGIDIDGIWERAEPARLCGADVLAMDPADLLLHLTTHLAFNHRFQAPLLAHQDIALVMSRLDSATWHRAVRTANDDGRAPFVFVALRVASEILHVDWPIEANDLRHGAAEERVVAAAREVTLGRPIDLSAGIRGVVTAEPGLARAFSILAKVFPRPAQLRRVYGLSEGSPLVAPFYLWRPFDLLMRRGRSLLDVMRGGRNASHGVEREEHRTAVSEWIATRRPSRDSS